MGENELVDEGEEEEDMEPVLPPSVISSSFNPAIGSSSVSVRPCNSL
jgi:hypothetical protein